MSMNYPPNVGHSWTRREEEKLWRMALRFESSLNTASLISECGRLLGRNPGGVRARLLRMGLAEHNEHGCLVLRLHEKPRMIDYTNDGDETMTSETFYILWTADGPLGDPDNHVHTDGGDARTAAKAHCASHNVPVYILKAVAVAEPPKPPEPAIRSIV